MNKPKTEKEILIFNYHLISISNRGLDYVIYKKFIEPKNLLLVHNFLKQLEFLSTSELKSILLYANKIDKEGLLSVLDTRNSDDKELYYEVMNYLMLPVDHKIQWKAINMLSKGRDIIDVIRMSNTMKENN